MVKIHHALREGKDFYEATRGNWKASLRRLEDNVQYVVGIKEQKVVCVFEPQQWHVIEESEAKVPQDVGRMYFDGSEATDDILARLQKSEATLLKKFGSGAAIAYTSLDELDA